MDHNRKDFKMNLHLLIAAAALAFSTSPLNAMDIDLPGTPGAGAPDFYADENVESLDLSNDEENNLDENFTKVPEINTIEMEDDEELEDMLESPLGDDPIILDEESEKEDTMEM
jgi:hypothetical protein